ncbi:MAG: HAMP domain-containing histidine kinase [Myxococcales bacterium]|nr:HAMP domain-containing histidine kinase [Myxococcales bacterium]
MNPLDTPVRLSELLEPAHLEELCTTFVALHRVGLRIFGRTEGQLVEVSRDDALAERVFAVPEARRRFVAFVDELKALRLEGDRTVVREDPVTGGRYLLLPVTWEHEILGKAVCGPYILPDADHLRVEGPISPDDSLLDVALLQLPRFTDSEVHVRLRFLLQAVDLICHAGYKALLTSSLHLASITEAHEDLQRANAELATANTHLKAQNTRLQELDLLKSNFLATVSHELRTPLTSIMGYAEMLAEELAGPINAEQEEYARTILERSQNLLDLIEGVLAFSRAEHSGEASAERHLVGPAQVVAEAVSAVRPQAQKGQLQLEVDVAAEAPALSTDPAGLRQALINLLGNAVKFTRPGGVVRLSVVPSSRGGARVVRFSVTDTGIGIPTEALDRIFEPFFQVDGSSTRAYGGTGLGLSIVKSFVEGQGGHIDVESATGVGTTITFDLPVAGPGGRS